MSSPQNRLKKIAGHFSPDRPVNRAELSPTYFLPRAATIEPNAEAIVHLTANGRTIRRTYQQFADRAKGLGYYLKAKGYKRIGILSPNTPAFLDSIFGIGGAGAVQVAINYRLKRDDIHYIFDHAEVDSIIVDREYVHLLDGFKPEIPRIIDEDSDNELEGDFNKAVLEGLEIDRREGGRGWEGLEMEAASEDDMIALAYTSGTTARPKGVEYTHRGAYLGASGNVVESGLNSGSVMPTGRAKYLTILPLFHACGWTFPWAVVSARATHYCLRKIDYNDMWRLLKDEGITHFNAAPTVNTLLCASPKAVRLPHEVRVTVAASPPTAKLFEDMIKLNLIPVHVYGLTETYGPITKGYFLPEWHNLPAAEMYRMMARQGHGFITSKMIRVIKTTNDISKTGAQDVAKNGQEIGEVAFTGNICCRGYYKDAEATAKLFEGGVLHSGDLAVWHPSGAIQILDRSKDIIISGGENISSLSLESMLVHHPDILECGVVAVPDAQYGERPMAFVTSRNPVLKGTDVITWAKRDSQISGFMVPREVEIVKELPKTETGKVKKNVLREWSKGNRSAH
ncbi:acetyl-CoA synthetase-like protein [Choiromyces venosus 120613-1]|uniref:Acetyl-CoA synthetase-like protein n=1 Tax=Choiromyces venosus 120613-1 TaxID=1336337 RepID=A0A3N4JMB2_9PEZI|nr:acetyl-CoA synthetase-like protein [Choiromyces venosus 120613-1]